jgi:hypothetical protein
MIADEIQTGIARTGKMLACDWENIRPDMVVSFFSATLLFINYTQYLLVTSPFCFRVCSYTYGFKLSLLYRF